MTLSAVRSHHVPTGGRERRPPGLSRLSPTSAWIARHSAWALPPRPSSFMPLDWRAASPTGAMTGSSGKARRAATAWGTDAPGVARRAERAARIPARSSRCRAHQSMADPESVTATARSGNRADSSATTERGLIAMPKNRCAFERPSARHSRTARRTPARHPRAEVRRNSGTRVSSAETTSPVTRAAGGPSRPARELPASASTVTTRRVPVSGTSRCRSPPHRPGARCRSRGAGPRRPRCRTGPPPR